MVRRSDHIYLAHEQRIEVCEDALAAAYVAHDHQAVMKLQDEIAQLSMEIYGQLSAWDRVAISRHPHRPRSVDFIRAMTSDFFELHGDRTFGDDRAVIGGLATIDHEQYMIVAQEKGHDTESRLECNFGMVSPEGFRKALRLMLLAERLQVPILSFIDTVGAYPGLEAEQRGQGWIIAENLRQMFAIATPMIVVIIGEGCSGGALGMAIGDHIMMLEHSYYTVISPEGCASILWKDASRKQDAALALRLTAEDLLQHKIIDEIVEEPLGGAHYDSEIVFQTVRQRIKQQWMKLKGISGQDLLDRRYAKFRCLGILDEWQ